MASDLKLPEFMEEDPETWFQVCESVFKIKGVDDKETRFHHLIARLPSRISIKIKDVLHMTEGAARYNALKKRLGALFGLSAHDRYLRLHSMPPLGSNQRPSDLLSNLRNLMPSTAEESDFWFWHLFISKLSSQMRSRCLEHDDMTVDQLANLMDKLVVKDLSTNFVHTVQEDQHHVPETTHCCSMRVPTLCFYHKKFKDCAQQCRPPCTWKPAGNGQQPGKK